jgi:hypothetical protein
VRAAPLAGLSLKLNPPPPLTFPASGLFPKGIVSRVRFPPHPLFLQIASSVGNDSGLVLDNLNEAVDHRLPLCGIAFSRGSR